MLKIVIVILVVLILAGGGFFVYQGFRTEFAPETAPPQLIGRPQAIPITPTATETADQASQDACQVLVNGSTDVQALYREGITWQATKMTEYEVPLAEGLGLMNGCLIKSANL